MKRPRQRCGWFLVDHSRAGRALAFRARVFCIRLGLALLLAAPARGQLPVDGRDSAASVSGQFLVVRQEDGAATAPLLNLPADTNVVHLEPAVLAVAAERFKLALWRQLDFPANATWSGKICLRLHPARSPNDTVTIAASPFLNHWNYEVELPDSISKTRYARALAGVLLLEIANRGAAPGGHSAELPSWLVDGMAQALLATDDGQVVLSLARNNDEDLPINRLNETRRGYDPLAATRRILQSAPALSFDQLSWPTDQQMEGADGGVYYASAQLFQSELLGLKNGRGKMRALLAELPQHLNWQTAFYRAFGADFKRPLDVEKWWALRVINFTEHSPGPLWTAEVSVTRLQELLSVPVEFRGQSNALPGHAEISLQAALQSLSPEQRDAVIENVIRELALVEFRLAPPFGGLAEAYRQTLAGFLGELQQTRVSAVNKHGVPPSQRTSVATAVKQLNALDGRRREAESHALATVHAQPAPGATPQTIPGPNGF